MDTDKHGLKPSVCICVYPWFISYFGIDTLGPSINSFPEGIAIGLSIGAGAGVSIGAIREVGKNPETTEKKHNKLLILVVASTALLVLLTFLYL